MRTVGTGALFVIDAVGCAAAVALLVSLTAVVDMGSSIGGGAGVADTRGTTRGAATAVVDGAAALAPAPEPAPVADDDFLLLLLLLRGEALTRGVTRGRLAA